MTTVWIYVDTNKEIGDIDHQGIRDARACRRVVQRERVALSAMYSLAQESRWCAATSAHRKAHEWRARIRATPSKQNTRHGLLRLCLQPLHAPVSSTNLNRETIRIVALSDCVGVVRSCADECPSCPRLRSHLLSTDPVGPAGAGDRAEKESR